LDVRRQRADDAGARSAVAARVALLVLRDDRLVIRADAHRPLPLDLADDRMSGLDAAVQDADADALAGRAAPGPPAVDPRGPLHLARHPADGISREAPGRKLFVLLFLDLVLDLLRLGLS